MPVALLLGTRSFPERALRKTQPEWPAGHGPSSQKGISSSANTLEKMSILPPKSVYATGPEGRQAGSHRSLPGFSATPTTHDQVESRAGPIPLNELEGAVVCLGGRSPVGTQQ